jgi:uncharacterized membrane protein YdjX (TVP38/TMEM64 family)
MKSPPFIGSPPSLRSRPLMAVPPVGPQPSGTRAAVLPPSPGVARVPNFFKATMETAMSTVESPNQVGAPAGGFDFKKLIPLALIAAGIAAFFALGLNKYLTFDQLRQHRGELTAFVAAMPVIAVALFIIVYAGVVALSVPGAAIMTLTGGFLFGIWEGTGAVVVGATIGATALFLAARYILGDSLRAKAGPWLSKMEAGFNEDALSYLLVLRLIPAFPFFIVNLVPAFLGVSLRTFVIATFVGIIPGTFVFASIGAGLGSIFDSAQEFSLKGALTPQVITALVGLAVLSLIPVVYKRIKARRVPSN